MSRAGSSLLDNINFAGVLIDEASQATELSTLVPLMHECQQLVLVGDHCQLPPTVQPIALAPSSQSSFDPILLPPLSVHLPLSRSE